MTRAKLILRAWLLVGMNAAVLINYLFTRSQRAKRKSVEYQLELQRLEREYRKR